MKEFSKQKINSKDFKINLSRFIRPSLETFPEGENKSSSFNQTHFKSPANIFKISSFINIKCLSIN